MKYSQLNLDVLPKLDQRQDSVTDQLLYLKYVAQRLGMYDAADFIQHHLKQPAFKQPMYHAFVEIANAGVGDAECNLCGLPKSSLIHQDPDHKNFTVIKFSDMPAYFGAYNAVIEKLEHDAKERMDAGNYGDASQLKGVMNNIAEWWNWFTNDRMPDTRPTLSKDTKLALSYFELYYDHRNIDTRAFCSMILNESIPQ